MKLPPLPHSNGEGPRNVIAAGIVHATSGWRRALEPVRRPFTQAEAILCALVLVFAGIPAIWIWWVATP